MESFEQVLDQYKPMIYSVLKKAKVFKNYDYFTHIATIALWEAWRRYDPSIGPFPPYAYRMMLTSIYKEMSRENKYAEHFISYEKDKLTFLAQYMEKKNVQQHCCSEFLIKLETILTKDELELLIDLYVKRYKYEELTDKYGISVSALKKRRERIVKRVREEFS